MCNNNYTTCRVRCASPAANLHLQCNVTALYRLGLRAVYELLCEVGTLTGNMAIIDRVAARYRAADVDAFIEANTYCPGQTAGEMSPSSKGAGAMTTGQISVRFVFLNRLSERLSEATQELEAVQELACRAIHEKRT
jgi:hypothetical protein